MTLIQIIVLSIIQGLTEFLPISSSAHLILGSKVFGWPDQGLVFDVATHMGTLLAVLVYFRKDLAEMLSAMAGRTGGDDASRTLGVTLIIASIPAIVAGALFHNLVEAFLRSPRVIAFATIGFGILLWWADARFAHRKTLQDMKLKPGVMIGLAQVFALIPGTSRSGITITMGRMLGFDASSAARFSFLLSIPIIAAAGIFGLIRMLMYITPIDWFQFGLAIIFSAMAGWFCIAAFLALLERIGLLPFVIYRLALGVVLLWIAFF